MASDTVFEIASSDIVFEEFDGDLVVLDIESGRYFGFNPTGRALWAALTGGASPSEICRSVNSEHLDERILGDYCDRLESHALVRAVSGRPSTALEASIADELRAAKVPPIIDIYDDLTDLIVADPIHDTDEEAGWPHVRAAE